MDHRIEGSLRALRRILQAADASARALARDTGMTGPQLMIMRLLAEAGEATPKTIAMDIRVAQGTATALIDKLEARGFVLRRRGEIDRRQIWVRPTGDGLAALAAAPDPLDTRFAERFARLAPWEQAMLLASLERVALMMGASGGAAAPFLHAGDIARDPAQDPVHDLAQAPARDPARDLAQDPARDLARDPAQDTAQDTARNFD
jgi:DNA-binding MarR family transcriptional regulator